MNLNRTSSEMETKSTSQFEDEKVNAIRDGKLVQVRWDELTSDEKRSAHVALFHQWGW